MELAESLFQALIPKGKITCTFEYPNSITSLIEKLFNDPTNLLDFQTKHKQIFLPAFKYCCAVNACIIGIPKHVKEQSKIFLFTFTASLIDFYTNILKRSIQCSDRYCSEIIMHTKNMTKGAFSTNLGEDGFLSFKHHKSFINTMLEQILFHCNEIESFTKLPDISMSVKLFLAKMEEIIQLTENARNLPAKRDANIEKIEEITKQIKTELILEIEKNCKNLISHLKGCFSTHYSKQHSNFLKLSRDLFYHLNNIVFIGLEISLFSKSDNIYYPLLYKIAKESYSIITNIHKLIHYRAKYNFSVVAIKVSYASIHNLLPQILEKIHECLKLSPTVFQATSNKHLSYSFQSVYSSEVEFKNKSETFFVRIQRSKKSIVYWPINVSRLAISCTPILYSNLQKRAFMIANCLINNNYSATKLRGMITLLIKSYTNLLDFIEVQIASKITFDEKCIYVHKLDNLAYSMSLFAITFSEFGAFPDDPVIRSKCALVILNLVFESCVCESNDEMTELLNRAFTMFLIFIGDRHATTSGVYLLYRRALQLSIFHNTFLFSKFSNLLCRQLKASTENSTTNLGHLRKLNKLLSHCLKNLNKAILFDRSISLPFSVFETFNEFFSFIDALVIRSEDHKPILEQSIANFKNFHQVVYRAFSRINAVQWDYNVESLKHFVIEAKTQIEHNESVVKSRSKYRSSSGFTIAQSVYEMSILARHFKDIPIELIESIENCVWTIFEGSTASYLGNHDNNASIEEALKTISEKIDIITPIVNDLTCKFKENKNKLDLRDSTILSTIPPTSLNDPHTKSIRSVYSKLNKALQKYRYAVNLQIPDRMYDIPIRNESNMNSVVLKSNIMLDFPSQAKNDHLLTPKPRPVSTILKNMRSKGIESPSKKAKNKSKDSYSSDSDSLSSDSFNNTGENQKVDKLIVASFDSIEIENNNENCYFNQYSNENSDGSLLNGQQINAKSKDTFDISKIANEIPQNEIPQNEIKQNEIRQNEIKQNEIKHNEIQHNEIIQGKTIHDNISPIELPTVLPNDLGTISNNISIIPNDINVSPNDINIFPNDISIIPNDINIIPNDISIIPNDISIIPNEANIIPIDQIAINLPTFPQDTVNTNKNFSTNITSPPIQIYTSNDFGEELLSPIAPPSSAALPLSRLNTQPDMRVLNDNDNGTPKPNSNIALIRGPQQRTTFNSFRTQHKNNAKTNKISLETYNNNHNLDSNNINNNNTNNNNINDIGENNNKLNINVLNGNNDIVKNNDTYNDNKNENETNENDNDNNENADNDKNNNNLNFKFKLRTPPINRGFLHKLPIPTDLEPTNNASRTRNKTISSMMSFAQTPILPGNIVNRFWTLKSSNDSSSSYDGIFSSLKGIASNDLAAKNDIYEQANTKADATLFCDDDGYSSDYYESD